MKFDIKKFYFENGLYLETEIDESDFEDIYRLIYCPSKVDAYCTECEKETIFEAEPNRPKKKSSQYPYSSDEIYNFKDFEEKYSFNHFVNSDFKLKFKCIREEYTHNVYFIVRVERSKIFKIGQFPSIADLAENFFSNKYEKILPKSKIHELNKAIGLNSHGIGIGAFVYLRRTFEHLIEETHQMAKKEIETWDESIYIESKMNKKVELLKNYLPEFLVENKNIYGILSKGIHELEENYCKKIFPLLKSSIEFILKEKVVKLENENKMKETTKLLLDISADIKNYENKQT